MYKLVLIHIYVLAVSGASYLRSCLQDCCLLLAVASDCCLLLRNQIWGTQWTRRNMLGICLLNFWLHLKRNSEHSAPAKDNIPSARDQLVALWTSWIEAKNDEDGTGVTGL